LGRKLAGYQVIFKEVEYEGMKETRERCDDIEADLFFITSSINGNPELAEFKRRVESVQKRIVELRKYVGA